MQDWTDYVVGQFIGGRAFFLGVALCLLGCCLKSFVRQTKIQAVARITILAGVIFVVLSAAPFSFWVYGLLLILLVLVAFRPSKARLGAKTERMLLVLLLAQSVGMVRTEMIHSRRPKIALGTARTLFVIGDSLSMGADPPGENWPEALGELAKLEVHNLSFGGAKVASSLDNALRINGNDALVILEIGGNDLLSGTSIPQFRQDLGKMMALVGGPHRRVAMIELPLPPFYNRFGMVQRELAKAHGVALIPKRYLADIITTPDCTVDGLHLSNAGHARLARAVFEMLN